MGNISLSDIDRGIRAGQAAVDALRTWVKGSEAYRICDERERSLRDAERALATLARVWPKAKTLLGEAERAYDRYVTEDRELDGCSCHLSAPCRYCTMQSDDDAEDA